MATLREACHKKAEEFENVDDVCTILLICEGQECFWEGQINFYIKFDHFSSQLVHPNMPDIF